jgi:hypothetical protein
MRWLKARIARLTAAVKTIPPMTYRGLSHEREIKTGGP